MLSMRGMGGLAGWLLACFAAAVFGALFPPGDWYLALDKPAWNPPAWLFAPVWTTLYIMMAVAAWRVWWKDGFTHARPALGLFVFQLVLNALWSAIFFGLHRPGAAFVHILILLAAILLTTHRFHRHDGIASALLVPYALWVAFASMLNGTLWYLN